MPTSSSNCSAWSAFSKTMTGKNTVDPLVDSLRDAVVSLERVILGKPAQLRLCVACLLARGHLLIEDVPGVGKTTLAHALARGFGLGWNRGQFTSDLLPADIVGVSVFDRATQQFEFRKGPVFTQLLLADEVNRASPRTQITLARISRPFSIPKPRNEVPDERLALSNEDL